MTVTMMVTEYVYQVYQNDSQNTSQIDVIRDGF